jgi:predicted metal-dependent phosphotriesterase family hydrolase
MCLAHVAQDIDESVNRRDFLKLGGTLAAQAPSRPPFPRGAIIRTILRDVQPDSLASGPSLFHEHPSMRFPLGAAEHFTADVAMMIEEAKLAKADGIAAIIDGGHADMNRSVDALKRISTESGLPIIASGGY